MFESATTGTALMNGRNEQEERINRRLGMDVGRGCSRTGYELSNGEIRLLLRRGMSMRG